MFMYRCIDVYMESVVWSVVKVGLVLDIKQGRACVVLFGPKTRPLETHRRWSEIDKHGEGFTPALCISNLPTLAQA